MEELVLFILCYMFVFFFYQVFIIGPAKKRKKSRKKLEKELMEIKYLENRYKLDLKKVDYNQLLQICALVSSLDISLVVSIISLINNFLLEIVGGLIFITILILISYHLVYLFYKKKGMICL